MWGLSRKRPASKSRAWAGRAASAPAKAVTRSPAAWKSPGPQTPTKWSNYFFENLFNYEWELTKSPAGAHQWVAKGADATVPDAHDPSKKRLPTMLTTDLVAAVRPGLRKNLAALPGESGSVRRRVRPGVVQADAPRHGSARALSRPGGPARRTHLAGPHSRGESQID